ncbi:hypothetical protein CC78DRAFT_37219 [Lojkania enalia]|uniref:Uncharacterized protein n=1 Tax=Lojkania enalia TaxID=147567 RepID=A0A9P4K070_9PLEO|nr:hypothetical protein CC78DRAFT_37219 [Didymosphaeria enalia]
MRVLKCADFNPDCTAKEQVVNANPDIAGIGVILGFLCTTCLAFLIAFSVLFLDRYEKIVNFFRKYVVRNTDEYCLEEKPIKYWRSPVFWSKVLSKNLLAFSDTQLLTGISIQFTAMLQHCKLSVYHFRVVTDLAFLTTVTHLLAVVTLRKYFVDNPWINLPRIFFMLGNLALLGYTSYVAYSYDLVELDLSSSLACFFKSERPRLRAAFGGKWAALLIAAIGGHATVIIAMYILSDKVLKKIKDKWWFWIGTIFRTWIIAPAYATYGIVMAGRSLRKTQALGTASVAIEGSETEWGFGQFLPLLLLALPLFAGWESFWEEKNWDKNLFSGSQRPSTVNVMQTPKSPNLHQQSTRDNSVAERTIESSGPSPMGTPRLRSTSHITISPHLTPMSTPRIPVSSPVATSELTPPLPELSPIASPQLTPPVGPPQRPRSPPRFEERLPR